LRAIPKISTSGPKDESGFACLQPHAIASGGLHMDFVSISMIGRCCANCRKSWSRSGISKSSKSKPGATVQPNSANDSEWFGGNSVRCSHDSNFSRCNDPIMSRRNAPSRCETPGFKMQFAGRLSKDARVHLAIAPTEPQSGRTTDIFRE